MKDTGKPVDKTGENRANTRKECIARKCRLPLTQIAVPLSSLKKAKPAKSNSRAYFSVSATVPTDDLVLFLTRLLAIALAGQGFFYTLLFAGLQVKGVTLHFFNDVFLLHLALEAAERIL